MCNLQPFFPSLERFFQALLTLLFASFQFFSILQVLVRGECGVCLHSAKLLLLFVLFRFPPSCGGAVGGTLSGVHSGPTNKTRVAFETCRVISRRVPAEVESLREAVLSSCQRHTTPYTTHLSSSLLAFGFLCISS
jgi:hypothetical protein